MTRTLPIPLHISLYIPLYRGLALLRRGLWRVMPRAPLPDLPRPRAPLRVGFVVCDSAKWGIGSLLAEIAAGPDMEAGFYPTLSDVHLRLPRADRAAAFTRERAFFAGLGSIWGDLYDPMRDRMAPLETITADVVFLQQPWGMQDWPRRLARRTRVAYVHYGMPVISNARMHTGLPQFHPYLWRHFLPTKAHADAHPNPGPATPVTGHPKFDVFATPRPSGAGLWPRAQARARVVVAPHHGLEPGSLGLGTFRWSGAVLMEMLRDHGDVDFVLRPHPNMGLGLARAGVMDAGTWARFKADWAAQPNGAVQEGGDYWPLLRSSDALITDAGSFLAEYLPTGGALIRLVQDGAAPLNAFGARLAPAFYTARTPEDLRAVFDRVVLAGEDPLAETRAGASALLRPGSVSAADAITAELRRLIL